MQVDVARDTTRFRAAIAERDSLADFKLRGFTEFFQSADRSCLLFFRSGSESPRGDGAVLPSISDLGGKKQLWAVAL